MKHFFRVVLSPLLAAFAAAAILAPAVATAKPTQHTENGVTYVSGGIGENDQQAMQAMRGDYNLHMTFAQKTSGAYLSDIKVNIKDAAGKDLVTAFSKGPFFFAKLPSGQYRVSVTYHDSAQTVPVDIEDRKEVDTHLYWVHE
ncbi:flagellar hook assembly protein FlgD [Paraburkholderia bannensis]|uniref:carboxypeptidase regulatory-like domain-containing protein n=1 Tax=Paraburkholderia bannensis TaxID=765414 RepID=UPI000693DD8A|nr:carboxypeptidase regulatory-like domain-containing protein [Paraburkholderia bannensis]